MKANSMNLRPQIVFLLILAGAIIFILGINASANLWPELRWTAGLLIGLPIYFLPSLIAHRRQHRNLAALFALNLLLGWTGIGWAVAIVWALYREK